MFSRGIRLPISFFGIPVYLDPSFLLVLPILAWLIGSSVPTYAELFGIEGGERLSEGVQPYLYGLIAALGLFVSVVLHELGHSVVARLYGVDVSRITLWFLGGMAHITDMPKRKGGEAVVGIAGPIVSYLLAGVFYALSTALPSPGEGASVVVAGWSFVVIYLAVVNFVLATFNLLPALPLDGGRILRSLLAIRLSQVDATRISVGVSRVIALGLGLFGIMGGGIFMVLIAVFVFFAGGAEARQTIVTDLLGGIRVGDVMSREIVTVRAGTPVRDVAERMIHEHLESLPVESDEGELVGIVTLDGLERASPDQAVESVAERLQSVDVRMPASEALRRLSQGASGRAIVVDDAGRPVGFLSRSDLQRAAQIRSVERGWDGAVTGR